MISVPSTCWLVFIKYGAAAILLMISVASKPLMSRCQSILNAWDRFLTYVLKMVLADNPIDDLMMALIAWAISADIIIIPASLKPHVTAKNGVRRLAENIVLGR